VKDVAETIGIRELRQNASRYIAMVKAGQRIAVTERGELVGYLEPLDQPRTTFDRMLAAGQVQLASGRGIEHLLDDIPEPGHDEGSPYEELMRMRGEERY
jgi:antitoxin (DNA-binding transcriptional repressor) of toxin-antitoxin stability system